MRIIEGETLKAREGKGVLQLYEIVRVLHPVGEACNTRTGKACCSAM